MYCMCSRQTFSLMKGRLHLTEFSLHPSILAQTFPPALAEIPPDPPCWTHMVPGWAEHTQLSQWITPTISSPPLRGPTYILPPLSTLFTILLVSLLASTSLHGERTTICWPKSLASPLKSPSLLPPPCLLLSGRKQHLPHYLTSCYHNCFFFFFPFSLFLMHCLCLCILGLRAGKRCGLGPAPTDEAVFSVTG